MSHSCICHHLINVVVSSTRHYEVSPSIMVASIYQHYLLYFIIQLVNQPLPHYIQARLCPAWNCTVPPNYPPHLQAYPYLILHTRSLEFMGLRHGIKQNWFLNVMVSTIQTYETMLACHSIIKSVLPFLLFNEQQC